MSKAKLRTTIDLDSNPFKKGLNEALGATNKFSVGFDKGMLRVTKSVAKTTTALAALSVAVVAVPLGVLAKKALAASGEIEVLRVAFESLTSSGGLTADILKTLEQQALSTGVSMTEQADAVRKFLALGIDPQRALRLQKSILDVAGAIGLNAFQASQLGFAISQVASKGVVQMEELRQQIAEKGVPIFEALSEKTGLWGLELQEAVRNGKIGAETLLEVFENYEGPFAKFRGGAERLGDTFVGVTNRMIEAWGKIKRAIGDEFLEEVKTTKQQLFDFLLTFENEANKLGRSFAVVFGKAQVEIKKLIETYAFFEEAVKAGKFGEIVETQLKLIVAEMGNVFIDFGNLARESWMAAVEFAANFMRERFTKEGQEVANELNFALGNSVTGLGDLIRSTLPQPFNDVVVKFQAGLTLAIDNVLEGASKVKLVFMEAMVFLEKQSAKLLISIASFINEYNYVFGIIGEKFGDKLLEKAGQALDRASEGRKEIEKLKQEGAFYEARTYEELKKQFSKQNTKDALEESGVKNFAKAQENLTNFTEGVAGLAEKAAQGIKKPEFKKTDTFGAGDLKKNLEKLDLEVEFRQKFKGVIKDVADFISNAGLTAGVEIKKAGDEAGVGIRNAGDIVKSSLNGAANGITRGGTALEDALMGAGWQVQKIGDSFQGAVKVLDDHVSSLDYLNGKSASLLDYLDGNGLSPTQGKKERAIREGERFGHGQQAMIDASKGQAGINRNDPNFKRNAANAMNFFMENMLAEAGQSDFVQGLMKEVDAKGWTQNVIGQIQKQMRTDPATGVVTPETKPVEAKAPVRDWSKLIASAMGFVSPPGMGSSGRMEKTYGRHSYEAQRQSNHLAKQNQAELHGINQKLASLGLIGA